MSAARNAGPPKPVIPEKYVDVPTQRLYCLSFGLLCQAIKLFDFFQYLLTTKTQTSYCKKWLFVDFAYCLALSQLRIPRLNYGTLAVLLQIACLWFIDGLLFGGIDLGISRTTNGLDPSSSGFSGGPSTRDILEPFSLFDLIVPLSFGLLSPADGVREAHLLGQHTVRMSPVSTAQLNPNGHTYCLAPPGNSILIPILLNNTTPLYVKYGLVPLGHTEEETHGKTEYFELNSKDLKAIERARMATLPLTKQVTSTQRDSDEYDEYDDDDDAAEMHNAHSALQKTQSLVHIRLTKPGRLLLQRVLDSSNTEARIAHPAEVIVAPCPSVEFADDIVSTQGQDVRCAGQNVNLEFMINVHGVPPLSLRWSKTVNGRKEHFLVEGIEGVHDRGHHSHGIVTLKDSSRGDVPQDLNIPLAVSLDALGTHLYALEEVMDGLGNMVVNPEAHTLTHFDLRKTGFDHNTGKLNTKNSRSLFVLRRPTVSFKHCGPGNPTPLLIGSEAPLIISANDADALDAPWEVTLKYHSNDEGGSKRSKPWKKTLKILSEKRDLSVLANASGEYTILGVSGKYCDGDVLTPETCKVVEKPMPTAQIEWKRIHECSGDTGVAASLIFHGTPPFHVYYRTQRDNEPPRELSKTFPSPRGELTLQPERSGHYAYSFTQMSDANYKKVELHGPSIDQVVHPLAAAEFVSGQAGTGRNKRVMSSCSGSLVDVDVDLRGTGPWNLEVQVVGPKSLETLQFPRITATRERLQIPIPKEVDKDGGSFDIDLINIEDSYGCKRPIPVSGISVNVRRVEPTVRFYGQADQRHITVLEREEASLPLRLTGDGPWRVKFRRKETEDQIIESVLNMPNDYLRVTDQGVYEILHVMDLQCPGSVVEGANTYRVDWVPRPSAKLSPDTTAIYETYNGSHILPPICENMDDHIDLELTGKPPFQIMYNIAQNSDSGGTQLLDQPTFSSIQPRTRFELHTSTAGRMYYEVKQIGDIAYPLTKHKTVVIPRSQRLLFEQEVLVRPSAQFRNQNKMSYCLHDFLVPLDALSMDGLVLLEGTPPFTLQLSIKNLAASHVDVKTVELFEKSWKLDLPSYTFESIGLHVITIESVQDASNCAQTVVDPSIRSIWVDVVETAAIIPFDQHEDHCVGEFLQFQLEGIPPWTIGYRINGKSYTQEARTSPVSFLQHQRGEFTITSIAHQQNMCKAAVTDLRFAIHPIPTALVGHGKKIIQDIHEGDQAEIVFTLIGEPPFAFTYQRSETSTRSDKPGLALEMYNARGVTTTEYSIFSASEGTWTVTSISDRYCRYPLAKPSGKRKL